MLSFEYTGLTWSTGHGFETESFVAAVHDVSVFKKTTIGLTRLIAGSAAFAPCLAEEVRDTPLSKLAFDFSSAAVLAHQERAGVKATNGPPFGN